MILQRPIDESKRVGPGFHLIEIYDNSLASVSLQQDPSSMGILPEPRKSSTDACLQALVIEQTGFGI